jgi:uncharacterized Tic20 family protein
MNQSTTAAVTSRIPLKLEEAPPFCKGTMTIGQERTFAMLAHFFPLIIWFWKRKDSPAVDAHGKEALNFGITMFICSFAISLAAGFLGSAVAGIISLVLVGLNLCVIALVVFAMLQARNGKLLRYPGNFRLIK